MSSYTFELKNYHAVKDAIIKIDGITVLAGINGSGKSTVSRWLHHLVYTLNQYESMVEESGVKEVSQLIDSMSRVLFSTVNPSKSREFRSIKDKISETGVSTMSQIGELYESAYNVFINLLDEHFREKRDLEDLERIGSFFNIEKEEDDTADDILNKLQAKLESNYQTILDNVSQQKETHSVQAFSDKLFSVADLEIEDPSVYLGLEEDGIELLTEEGFKIPLMLRNVIYIDTHEIGQALNFLGKDSELARMLRTKYREPNDNARIIARMIQNLIGGEVQVVNEPISLSAGRFRFVSKNGQSFNLKGAATGVISFSYLLQLLQNGWINENTLLIIDEPESHLHPQWVVEYARILIMINKLLGAKIVISSHNPDMISAIESIARKEKLEEVTRFYLSESTDELQMSYSFRDLGFEIAQIFDSFNVAIDRIVFYSDNE